MLIRASSAASSVIRAGVSATAGAATVSGTDGAFFDASGGDVAPGRSRRRMWRRAGGDATEPSEQRAPRLKVKSVKAESRDQEAVCR